MKLANIVPPQWAWLYPQGEYQMALAHWVLQYPEYVQEIQKLKKTFVLLDNGSFEGSQVTSADLQRAYVTLDADEVILPDALGDPRKTLQLSWQALPKVPTKRVVFVPQGTTQEDRQSCLDAWINQWEGSEWKDHCVLTIGITSLRKEPGGRVPQLGTRVPFMRWIADQELTYPLHLLGIPDPEFFARSELWAAHSLGVRGVDSSIAFALGAAGKLLTPSSPKIHLGHPDAHSKLSTYRKRLIFLNQKILRQWVHRGESSPEIPTYWIRQLAANWLKYYAEGFADLSQVMKECGMPTGQYALRKLRRREISVEPLGRRKLEEGETLVEIKR